MCSSPCTTTRRPNPSFKPSSPQPRLRFLLADNPGAVVNDTPGMVKIDCPKRLTIRRETIEANTGNPFNLQDLHLSLISLSGNIEEDEDEFVLQWNF